MKKKAIIPAVMCATSLLFIFVVIPSQTKSMNVTGDLEPSVFPSAAMSVIALLSGILFWQELKKKEDNEILGFGRRDFKYLLGILGGLGLYILLVKYIGYYTITAIAMIAMLRRYDCMKWRLCIAGTAIYLILSYFLFEVGLRITLPSGIFI